MILQQNFNLTGQIKKKKKPCSVATYRQNEATRFIKAKPKYVKQVKVDDLFMKIHTPAHSTQEEPLPGTSSIPDIS